jgi:hypothetical protein
MSNVSTEVASFESSEAMLAGKAATLGEMLESDRCSWVSGQGSTTSIFGGMSAAT